jgi:pyrimidine-nucleoside phosphorylase
VVESIQVLHGVGPADTRALVVALGAEMLVLGGAAAEAAEGARRIAAVLDDGRALEKMRQIVAAQGGNPEVCDDPTGVLPAAAPDAASVTASKRGFVAAVDAEAIGRAVVLLGGGRLRKDDHIDPSVGIEIETRLGEEVRPGQVLAVLRGRGDLGAALATASAAYTIADAPPAPRPLILEVLREDA